MWVFTIVATMISTITIVLFVNYRRQVKDTCRSLKFLQKHKTNFRLPSGLPFKELNNLSDEINNLLNHCDKMERKIMESDRERKDTITSISHDIRTPLTSLDGFFQLLKNAETREEKIQYTEIIENRIHQLKYMLEELFTYTKLQNEGYEISMEKLEIQSCICTAVLTFYQEFQEKNIQVHTEFTCEKIQIKGNEEAIYRLIQNLLKNVLEHGSSHVKMVLKKEEENVCFSCSNQVMSPESIDISKVFTHFYKSDTARSNTTTGLGLAIAKSLTERMGGQIHAELIENWFTIHLFFPILEECGMQFSECHDCK